MRAINKNPPSSQRLGLSRPSIGTPVLGGARSHSVVLDEAIDYRRASSTMSALEEHGRQPTAIEISVERLSALFDALDPFPLPSRDLAPAAEDFITGWARELPSRAPLSIVVHAPDHSTDAQAGAKLQEAFQRHFRYRAERTTSDLHELFRNGRISLLTGLTVLALCVALSALVEAQFSDTHVSRFFGEGLIILGWVANWRPIEIFLYDWWPLVKRRRLYLRLAGAPVSLRSPLAVRTGS